MKKIRTLRILLLELGIDPQKTFNGLKGLGTYFSNLKKLKNSLAETKQPFTITGYYPQLNDRSDAAGTVSLHYFKQDLHVARLIHKNNPARHVDIGSRIEGFVAMVSVYREIEVFDIRKFDFPIPNVIFRQVNLMEENREFSGYCDSISCLHAIEHFGLGRYGDPVDAEGHIKGLSQIKKMLKPGGTFYFSTPIGKQRIEFDAHRVFSVKYLLDLFEPDYTVKSFSMIDDNNNFYENAELSEKNIESSFGCSYGCGIFELVKK